MNFKLLIFNPNTKDIFFFMICFQTPYRIIINVVLVLR